MKKRRRILWAKLVSILVGLLVLVSIFYIYFISGIFTIKNYDLLGVEETYMTEITEELDIIASTKILGIFPGNRTITPHRKDIRILFQEVLPNTSSIKIFASSLHTLTIEVATYKPLFSVSETHAITKDGVIYKEIHNISNLPRISIATSTSVSPETLSSLATLVPKIDSMLYPVKYINIDESNDIYMYDSRKSHSVIIPSNTNMIKIWSTILSALDTDPLKTSLQKKKDELEYIDARFGNKIFYKFSKNNLINEQVVSTSSTQYESTTTSTTTTQ